MFTSDEIANLLKTDSPAQKSHYTSVSTDTRTLKKGALFVALKGPQFDGHDFLEEAFKRGAKGAVVHAGISTEFPLFLVDDTLEALGEIAAYYRHLFQGPVIAITGSNGKTTAKEFISQVIEKKFKVLSSQGNFNNLIGVPLTLLRYRPDHEVIVMEAGISEMGEMDRLGEIIQPDHIVLTSIGLAHLEGLTSLSQIFQEKTRLLRFHTKKGGIFVNGDDARLAKLASEGAKRYGFSAGCDIQGRVIEEGLEGTLLEISFAGKEKFAVRLRGNGKPFCLSALAAVAVGQSLGLSNKELEERLTLVEPQPHRGRIMALNEEIYLIDDTYNANPSSTEEALRTLKSLGEGRRIGAVLGDMMELGADSEKLHQQLGRFIGNLHLDFLITYGQKAHKIGEAAIALRCSDVFMETDSQKVVTRLLSLLKSDTIVLFKGSRKMRMEQIVDQFLEPKKG